MNTILIKNLDLIRGSQKVLSNINLSLHSQDTLLVTGPNGSGKSSLLQVLSGLIQPTNGLVLYEHNYTQSLQENIHFISNKDPLHDDLTVSENLFFLSNMIHSSFSYQDFFSPEETLLKFNLSHAKDLPVKYLSFGQRKRLSLSRLVACYKPIWILDEPTVGLDKESVNFISYLISTHKKLGGIIIVASHLNIKLNDALHICLPR